jgi:intracellular septation protein
MKILFDFLPVLLFFGTFKFAEGHRQWAADFVTRQLGFAVSGGVVGPDQAPVLLATAVVIVATLAQVLWLKLRRRKVHAMLWVGLVLVVLLGGATVWFHSDTFIKWKPSMLYWTMGLALWLGPLLFGRNVLRLLLGEQLQLPDRVWHRLSFAWVAFFGTMGLANLWVAYSFPTETWVDFKLFGGVGLTMLFTLGQAVYLSRHLKQPPTEAP